MEYRKNSYAGYKNRAKPPQSYFRNIRISKAEKLHEMEGEECAVQRK
jgi:hypothetical protein